MYADPKRLAGDPSGNAANGALSPDAKPVRQLAGLFLLDGPSTPLIYGPEERREIAKLVNIYAPPQTPESIKDNPALLADVEVLFSGWGAPKMDEAFLAAAPKLRAVFYGAGSIGYCTSEAFWNRGIIITTAAAANAMPVAEYTLAAILFSLKHFWRFAAQAKVGKGWGNQIRQMPGGYRSTVALIGSGMIAQRVIMLLKAFDLHCVVYDPFLTREQADELGVELCTLEEAFRLGDVVSLHAAHKAETHGMITGELLSMMKEGATFINTSRGGIVRQEEMIEVFRQRGDLTAVLDVCDPEPLPAGSPLLGLDNVVVSSHISGSHGPECQRLGRYMVEELRRYLDGKPLRWQVTREAVASRA